jgi:hypothetical protein
VHLSALGKALIKRHGAQATPANAQAQPRARSGASLFPTPP